MRHCRATRTPRCDSVESGDVEIGIELPRLAAVLDRHQQGHGPIDKGEIVAQLCGEMGAMLKEINDPWYTEKILSDRIPY